MHGTTHHGLANFDIADIDIDCGTCSDIFNIHQFFNQNIADLAGDIIRSTAPCDFAHIINHIGNRCRDSGCRGWRHRWWGSGRRCRPWRVSGGLAAVKTGSNHSDVDSQTANSFAITALLNRLRIGFDNAIGDFKGKCDNAFGRLNRVADGMNCYATDPLG